MANAPIEINSRQLLRDPQGNTQSVLLRDVDRLLQEGWRPVEGDNAPTSVYEKLLQEDAERNRPGVPPSIQPVLPGPMRVGGPPPAPGAPDVAGGGVVADGPMLPGVYRNAAGQLTTSLALERQMEEEEQEIIAGGGPPAAVPGAAPPTPPAPEQPPGRIFPPSLFPQVLTETLPDGSVRLLPHVAQPFTLNERDVVEGYMSAFQPGAEITATGQPPAAGERSGIAAQAPRYYQFWGELVREGDERLAPGEQPYLLQADGTRVNEIPEGAAFQPSTGRVYVERPGREVPIVAGEPGLGIRHPAQAIGRALRDPFRDLQRAAERLELGLTVPDRQLFAEAMNIQGLIAGGTAFGFARARPGTLTATAARPDVPTPRPAAEFVLGTGGAGSRTTPPGRRPPPIDREVDPAGFHVQSLEVARRDLPERATARDVREILVREGVENAEIRALGIDELLLGPVGVARRQRDESRAALSRASNRHGRILRQIREHPDNVKYREDLINIRREMQAAANAARVDAVEAFNAERMHIMGARRERLRAEAELKEINKRIRGAAAARINDTTPLYAERARARQLVRQTDKALHEASRKGPEDRIVAAQEVIDHIRTNRPILDTFVRRYPEGWQGHYGEFTPAVQKIRRTNAVRDALLEAGVPDTIANYVGRELAQDVPSAWPPILAAAGSRIAQPWLIRETVERVAGARIRDMIDSAARWQNDQTIPRYRRAIPDSDNPTLAEIAITLKNPREGSAPYVSPHWRTINNPIAHMQTSIQRLPRLGDTTRSARIAKELNSLSDERIRIGTRLENDADLSQSEWLRLSSRISAVDRKIERLQEKMGDGASENLVYLGNQFQSDLAIAAAAARQRGQGAVPHPLVESTRAWITPTMEAFVDQGIKSGLRRIAIPTGETVRLYNPMEESTTEVYNIVRRELDRVLERRGITPVSRRDINRIYPIDERFGSDPNGYAGAWHVIELPERAPVGARLFSNPDEPAAAGAALTLSNISRGPSYDPQLMQRRGTKGQSLVRRVREVQPSATELAHYPRAERVEMLGIDDPHPGPVIAHHATRADFSTFDLGQSSDIGHHFGTRLQANNRMHGFGPRIESGSRVIPAYLDVRSPFELPDLGQWSPGETSGQILNIVRRRGSIRDVEIAERMNDAVMNGGLSKEEQYVAIRSALTDMGYDSIRYQNNVEGSGWSYIVWQRGRVRSVTDPTHQLYQGGVLVPLGDRDGQEPTESARRPRNRSSR